MKEMQIVVEALSMIEKCVLRLAIISDEEFEKW